MPITLGSDPHRGLRLRKTDAWPQSGRDENGIAGHGAIGIGLHSEVGFSGWIGNETGAKHSDNGDMVNSLPKKVNWFPDKIRIGIKSLAPRNHS